MLLSPTGRPPKKIELKCDFGSMNGIVEAPDELSKVALRQLWSGEFRAGCWRERKAPSESWQTSARTEL